MKKAMALFLAASILVSAMAGCGNEKKNKDTSEDGSNQNTSIGSSAEGEVPELAATYPEFAQHREIDITWFEQGWTGLEKSLDIITPEIEKRTNLKMNYEAMTVPTEQDYNQKLNLMIASKEVPEVFFGGSNEYTRSIYEKLGATDTLWDFKDIIKEYKNLDELVDPEMKLYRTEGGNNFFIPTQTGRGYEVLNEPYHGMFIRQDFLDQLGMEYPKTPEELHTYLKRATTELTVNGNPVKGILFGENIGGINHLLEMYFPQIGERDNYGLPYDPKDDYKVKNYEYTDSPELMKGAQFVSRLVREGLTDSEALTIQTAQFQEKGSSGEYALMFSNWWDMNTFTDNAKSEIPELMWVTPPPVYETEQIRESRTQPWTNWVGAWSSLIVNKNIDEDTVRHLLAAMDYFATTEGQLLVQAGIESETYTLDEDGKYSFTEEFIAETNDLDWNKAAARGVFYYAQLVNNTPAIADLQSTPPALLREDNRKGWENQKEKRDAYDKDMQLTLDYYFLPGPVQTEKLQPIKDMKLEFFSQIMLAQSEAEVESAVNNWGKTCEAMGINDIIEEKNQIMGELKKAYA